MASRTYGRAVIIQDQAQQGRLTIPYGARLAKVRLLGALEPGGMPPGGTGGLPPRQASGPGFATLGTARLGAPCSRVLGERVGVHAVYLVSRTTTMQTTEGMAVTGARVWTTDRRRLPDRNSPGAAKGVPCGMEAPAPAHHRCAVTKTRPLAPSAVWPSSPLTRPRSSTMSSPSRAFGGTLITSHSRRMVSSA